MRLPSIAGDPQEAQDKYPNPISPCEGLGSSEAKNIFLRSIYCLEPIEFRSRLCPKLR